MFAALKCWWSGHMPVTNVLAYKHFIRCQRCKKILKVF